MASTPKYNQEKDFLDDIDVKPKKQLSEQKLQHLANIRVKALEKKVRCLENKMWLKEASLSSISLCKNI